MSSNNVENTGKVSYNLTGIKLNASSVVPTPTKNRRDMAMGVKTPEDTFSQMLSTSN